MYILSKAKPSSLIGDKPGNNYEKNIVDEIKQKHFATSKMETEKKL